MSRKVDREICYQMLFSTLFLNNEEKIVPCTAKAITDILDYYGIVIEGKKIVILGRSNIVGKPLALELIARNGTVTLCHSKTSNVGQETKNADTERTLTSWDCFFKKTHINTNNTNGKNINVSRDANLKVKKTAKAYKK